MAVAGVGIERHIGQHAKLWHRLLERTHRAAHQVVGIERFFAALRAALDLRVGEQRQAGNAGIARFRGA